VLTERKASPIHDEAFALDKDGDTRLELTFKWTDSTDEHVRSYVNGIPTASGGSHENGFRAGLSKAVRGYLETHKLTPRGVKITHEDIREGLVGILSVFVADPQFQGQTKDRLNNPEVQAPVDGALRLDRNIGTERKLWWHDAIDDHGARRVRVSAGEVLSYPGTVGNAVDIDGVVTELLADSFEVGYGDAGRVRPQSDPRRLEPRCPPGNDLFQGYRAAGAARHDFRGAIRVHYILRRSGDRSFPGGG